MGTVNVYVPDDMRKLLDQFRDELNFSTICQQALRDALEARTRQCSRCGQDLPPMKEGEASD